jgi:hypothetical protein
MKIYKLPNIFYKLVMENDRYERDIKKLPDKELAVHY